MTSKRFDMVGFASLANNVSAFVNANLNALLAVAFGVVGMVA